MTALTRNPVNTDLLQPHKFQITFDRLPNVTYFCQTASLPGISLTEVQHFTPFIDLFRPGEKAIYDNFNTQFLVNEDLSPWFELHDWIRSATFPTDFEEYVNLARTTRSGFDQSLATNRRPAVYTDGTLVIYSNKNNPRFRIKFRDIFPNYVGSINFNTLDNAETTVTCDVSFRFSYYDIEKLEV
jgi:hypothetical protein